MVNNMAIKSNKTNGNKFEINFDGAHWLKCADCVGQTFTIYHVLKCSTKYGKKWCAVFTDEKESEVAPVLMIIPNSNQNSFDEITNADIEANGGLTCELKLITSKNGNDYYKLEW